MSATISRDALLARPALAAAHRTFCDWMGAQPLAALAFVGSWLYEHGYPPRGTLEPCTDEELAQFTADVATERQGLRDARRNAPPTEIPDPPTVTEIREAKKRAAKRAYWEGERQTDRQEAALEALGAARQAARLKWIELGLPLESMPDVQWATPYGRNPFAGVR